MSLNEQDYWIKLNEKGENGHTINLKNIRYFKKYGSGPFCIELYDYEKECHDCWFGNEDDRKKFVDFLNKYFDVRTVEEAIEEYE